MTPYSCWCNPVVPRNASIQAEFEKLSTCRCLFWGLCLQLGPTGEYFSWCIDLKDFFLHISIRSQFYLGELYKICFISEGPCACVLYFLHHICLFDMLSFAVSGLRFLHVCFSNCRYDHGGYALDSQSLSETKSRGSGVRMNWKTLSEVKNENLGHGEKVHLPDTEHIHFHKHMHLKLMFCTFIHNSISRYTQFLKVSLRIEHNQQIT